MNILIYCPNRAAFESEKAMLNYTWTVGVTGKLGLAFEQWWPNFHL